MPPHKKGIMRFFGIAMKNNPDHVRQNDTPGGCSGPGDDLFRALCGLRLPIL